ncbi:MAG TPA: hypothetical protein VGP93_15325 [Polyangiaceae bacterium]|nr:hypothetical protein [Polyangiaceae bacterium]
MPRLCSRLSFFPLSLLLVVLWPERAQASVSVCVDVQVKSWSRVASPDAGDAAHSAPSAKPAAPAPVEAPAAARAREFEPIRDFYHTVPPIPAAPAAPSNPSTENAPTKQASPPADPEPRDPYVVDPAAYLKRLLEYEVTHAEGFVTVPRGCSARITVELYTLASGWTVFARFTRNGREEKVDRVELDEFEPLAQRIAQALLEDRPIGDTITRENVLRDDSAHAVRTVRGRGHAAFAMGEAIRVGELPTAQSSDLPVEQTVRVLTPFAVQLGYRLKIKSWGLDAFTRVTFNTQGTAVRNNQLGGHIDYAGGGALGLHFVGYTNGVGVNSFYYGGGAALELSLFDVIRAEASRQNSDRSWLMGGGLNVELVCGYEILRASAVHFFGEIELIVPTYAFDTENSAGSLRTYLPGGLVQVGVVL